MKKLTPKRKARLTQILEALKSHNYIQSYQIGGDEMSSVQTEWVEGGAERAAGEISENAGPAGIRASDRGWVAVLLSKECRKHLTDATLSSTREKALRLCEMIVEPPLGYDGRQK